MMLKYSVLLVSLAIVAGPTASAATAANPTTEPLLEQSNLVYLGSFRLPEGTTDQSSFRYAGRGLAYNPANNSLFLTGHAWYELTAEVSIPTPVASTSIADLPTGQFLQQFADATNGKRTQVNPSPKTPDLIGGYLVYNGKLIVSVYSFYDGGVNQTTSHFTRPLVLSSTSASGPYSVGSQYPGFVSGYMALVPPEWQSLLGGPAITGNCCLSILGAQSNGPAVSVFNPDQLATTTSGSIPATPLVGYPNATPLGTGWNTQSDLFNGSTKITGVVFPSGTRTVLFFGLQGTGPFCYGEGTTDPALNLQPLGGTKYCYDPMMASKGDHAYPYVSQVWAYDANDLLKVAQGSEPEYAIKPYAVWTLSLPFATPNISHGFGGAAYDPGTNRIYVTQNSVDTSQGGPAPVVDVFQITSTAPSPVSPGNVAVR